MLDPQISQRRAARIAELSTLGLPHREANGEQVILVVEDDWRTRYLICTVLS
jgi:hypothetical protein